MNQAPDSGQDPPRTFLPTLMRMGPGIILAGSIVGSGELVATTKVGAQAGFCLLWLILLGCLIKVFTQVEIGRFTITWGRTSLEGLDGIPGPRLKVSWLLWYWLAMTCLVLTQQGGIVAGVGQTLTIGCPLTERGRALHDPQDRVVRARVEIALREMRGEDDPQEKARLKEEIEALAARIRTQGDPGDTRIWAAAVAAITAILLATGRYRMIQMVSLALVSIFTFVTIATVVVLQTKPDWRVSGGEILSGFMFRAPPRIEGIARTPAGTALAAFGLIGVGAAELIMYPYWLLEKGYARFTGPRDGTARWLERARGWIRVMVADAWVSMAVYTSVTVAFYLLGAAVLGRAGLDPADRDFVHTLAQMYVPVFGSWAEPIFLLGAFSVLYSTFFVALAGNARIAADALGLFGLTERSEASRRRWAAILGGVFPLLSLAIYLFVKAPVEMILASGLCQAVMLPMLGGAALYFRYRRSDPSLRPGRLWDAMLWLSFGGFLAIGGWAALTTLFPDLLRS